MKIRILRALLVKEVKLMKRNPLIPKIIIMMPIMVMLVLPLVANLDVKNVGVTVVDNDHSQLSRRMIADVDASQYLDVKSIVGTHDEAMRSIEDGVSDVILSIPPHYSRDITMGTADVDIEANGVNATKGMLGAQYVSQSVMGTLRQWRIEKGIITAMPETSVINLYNPTLNFRNYMIPALIVVLLIIICGFLPALNLVNEKESGTIEAMNVTPVSRFGFVLSKLIPFWIVALIVVTIGMTIGLLVYGLKPVGSLGAIYLVTILFSLTMSGLGVTIANKSATMLQSIFVMFAFIMIFQLMGGLFTPIRSMPEWAQCITYSVPPRYFIEIIRAVYLKGAGVADLWVQYAVLAGFAGLFSGLAAMTYSKRS